MYFIAHEQIQSYAPSLIYQTQSAQMTPNSNPNASISKLLNLRRLNRAREVTAPTLQSRREYHAPRITIIRRPTMIHTLHHKLQLDFRLSSRWITEDSSVQILVIIIEDRFVVHIRNRNRTRGALDRY